MIDPNQMADPQQFHHQSYMDWLMMEAFIAALARFISRWFAED